MQKSHSENEIFSDTRPRQTANNHETLSFKSDRNPFCVHICVIFLCFEKEVALLNARLGVDYTHHFQLSTGSFVEVLSQNKH
jgi:hypothetical protein